MDDTPMKRLADLAKSVAPPALILVAMVAVAKLAEWMLT